MTDSPTGRRTARLLAALAVLALVVVAARTADDATVTDVLSIPKFETVRADRLANGTPVFVVHTPADDPDQDPIIDVIQAFVTEVEGPITGLVGWCAAGGQFVDPHHGALYDTRGRRLPATLRGRSAESAAYTTHTALDDLVHRSADPIEGRSDPDDPVVVTGIQPLQPWQVQQRPVVQSALPPPMCRLPRSPVTPDPDAEPSYPQMIDHSFIAGPIDAEADGWQIADGWIIVDVDGRGRWCSVEPTRQAPPRCPGPAATVDVGFRLAAADVGGVAAVIGGPLAVRVREGVIQRAATMPNSTWRGSSLHGTERHRGNFAGLDTAREEVHIVLNQPPSQPSCLAGFRRVPRTGAAATAIPVTGDTQFDMGQQRLAAEIIIDRATCHALVVRDAV